MNLFLVHGYGRMLQPRSTQWLANFFYAAFIGLCPDNWEEYNGKCYYHNADTLEQIPAFVACQTLDMQARLVVPQDQAEIDFLQGLETTFWLGMSDNVMEGRETAATGQINKTAI